MKQQSRKTVVILSVISILAFTCCAYAANLVIRFDDGNSVTYDTRRITSITFGGAPLNSGRHTDIPHTGSYLLNEEFNNGLSTIWEPIQVVGGNFERFANLSYGKLLVAVPAGNSWGKTGIMSRSPLFSIDQSMAMNPLKITFDFDPAQTTGYIIALAQPKDADVWRVQNLWFHWGRPSVISGKAYITNTQNQGDKGAEASTPAQAPKTVTLSVRPGSVEATTSHGTHLSMNLGWMKQGVPVYLYIFSHPWNQHEAASFALKSIRISQ